MGLHLDGGEARSRGGDAAQHPMHQLHMAETRVKRAENNEDAKRNGNHAGEGGENALSAATLLPGIGAWAAAGASNLPALVPLVPDYLDTVLLVIDPDPTIFGVSGPFGLITVRDFPAL